MNNDILKIEDLNKSFTRNIINMRGKEENERFNIIDELDLFIPESKITALIGGNGAGKTTLFNIISRFTESDSGRISFHNNQWLNILKQPAYKLKHIGIGRLFQDNHIFQQMTVLENMLIADDSEWGERPFISLFKANKNKEIEKKRTKKVEKILFELFGINNPFWQKRKDLASSLSFGQQRLLGLARLFMGDYKLVLLDEPTAGVNPDLVKTICIIIKRMVKEKGLTVFLIEHNMKVVLEIADFCSFMSHGKITAFGSPKDVIGDENVRRTYLGM